MTKRYARDRYCCFHLFLRRRRGRILSSTGHGAQRCVSKRCRRLRPFNRQYGKNVSRARTTRIIRGSSLVNLQLTNTYRRIQRERFRRKWRVVFVEYCPTTILGTGISGVFIGRITSLPVEFSQKYHTLENLLLFEFVNSRVFINTKISNSSA